jgi:hypothetical protein
MPLHSRSLPGFELLIGYLTGAVYLQRQVEEDLEAGAFIQEGYFEFLDSAMHIIHDQDSLGLDGVALRQHCKVYLNYVGKDLSAYKRLPEGKDTGHLKVEGSGYYVLRYNVEEYDDGLYCCWQYNTSFYSPERIEFMDQKLGLIMEKICLNPLMTIGELLQGAAVEVLADNKLI